MSHQEIGGSGVEVVVPDGSGSYRSAITQHLGHATHVLDRFHVARWFAAGMIEVRRCQHIIPAHHLAIQWLEATVLLGLIYICYRVIVDL